jgi:hypothetical protein
MPRMGITKDIRKEVKAWADQIGPHVAISRLTAKRVGARTAERLAKGIYDKVPQGTQLTILELELAKDCNPQAT